DVAADLGATADEGVRAHAGELDQAADAADRRVLSDFRVTAHRDLGDDDGALADPRIVADVAGRHEQAVGPDLGDAFGSRGAMDGDVLANHRPRTDAHARDGGSLELRVLGIGADDGAGTDAHASAELDPALDDDVRPDLDVGRQLRFRAHDRERPDLHADSDLSAQDHASPDLARARDPGLCRDDGILTDLHVVGHHDEIVDLHAASHDGRSQRAAVDRRVGADLDVVLDDHAADLGNLPMGRA